MGVQSEQIRTVRIDVCVWLVPPRNYLCSIVNSGQARQAKVVSGYFARSRPTSKRLFAQGRFLCRGKMHCIVAAALSASAGAAAAAATHSWSRSRALIPLITKREERYYSAAKVILEGPRV